MTIDNLLQQFQDLYNEYPIPTTIITILGALAVSTVAGLDYQRRYESQKEHDYKNEPPRHFTPLKHKMRQ